MRRHNGFILRFSLIPLALLIVAGIFRIVFVIEFPSTIVIGSEVILPAILDFLSMELFRVYSGIITIHIYDLLLGIWIIGSLYNFHKYVRQSIKLYSSFHSLPSTHDIQIITCMNEIMVESKKNMKIKIIKSEEIIIPMITGYFKPVICLPDIQFSDDELKNILLHEWTHFLHKDAWVKLFVYLISVVFWWNPFVHILKQELNHILEIQCDLRITSKMNEESRVNYLESILKIIKSSRKSAMPNTIPMNCAALVSTNKTKKIEQRFTLVLGYDSNKKQRIFQVILLCSMILLSFLASYKVVIQPRTFSTVEAGYEETFTITPENSYLTVNENGTYSLYADGIYRFDISKIDEEPFSSLPIK
jgi:beta-lactamase regulating signal transducer with metallopeptidase domain